MTTKKCMDIFVYRLNRKMNIQHITQNELAIKTGISKTTMSRYLNKKRIPRIDAVIKIANVLGCSISELIDVNENNH